MKHRILFVLLVLCAISTTARAQNPALTPYAGQQVRAIKALSKEDAAALLKGEGMGMANLLALFVGEPEVSGKCKDVSGTGIAVKLCRFPMPSATALVCIWSKID